MKKDIFLLISVLLLSSLSFANRIEWYNIGAFGGVRHATSNPGNGGPNSYLYDAGGQFVSTNYSGESSAHKLSSGYIISIPAEPRINAICNGNPLSEDGICVVNPNNPVITFTNAACATPPCNFYKNNTSPFIPSQATYTTTQYYRYALREFPTYDSVIHQQSTTWASWSDVNAKCPGGSCSSVGTSINLSSAVEGAAFLFVTSYNAGIRGPTKRFGPYYYDPQQRIVWRYPTTGTEGGAGGFSAITISGNNIYVSGYDGVYNLSTAGTFGWEFNDSDEPIQTQGGVSSKVTVYNNNIYFGTNAGRLYRISSGGSFGEKVIINSGQSVKPTLARHNSIDKVFVGGYDTLHCRVATSLATTCTGWSLPNLDDSHLTARPVPHVGGGFVFAASEGGRVYKINMSNGVVDGTYPASGSAGKITGMPTFLLLGGQRMLYFGDHNGVVHAVNTQNMTASWTRDVGDGAANDKIEDSLHADATLLHVGWHDGSSIGRVYRLLRSDGTVTHTYGNFGKITTAPLHATWCGSPRIYVGSEDGRLYCIDPVTGNTLWRFQTGGRITGSLILPATECKIYLTTEYGKVYKLNP